MFNRPRNSSKKNPNVFTCWWRAVFIVLVGVQTNCLCDNLAWRETTTTQAEIVSLTFERPDHCSKDSKKPSCRRRLRLRARYAAKGKPHLSVFTSSQMDDWGPLLDYLPEGARFRVRYATSAPDLWKIAFQHELDDVEEHIEKIRHRPLFTKPLIQLEPLVSSKTKDVGYLIVHISELLLKVPWAEHDSSIAVKKNGSRWGSGYGCNNVEATLDGVIAGRRLNGYNFQRRVLNVERDRMFVIPEARSGQELKVVLHCFDKRITYRKENQQIDRIQAHFKTIIPRNNQPVTLTVVDAQITPRVGNR